MPKSPVYYIPFRGNHAQMARRLADFLLELDLPWIKPQSHIGIKLHWGEAGNETYQPIEYAREIGGFILQREAIPFGFDTTTLYRHRRRTVVDSLWTAQNHGFHSGEVGFPFLVADGISGLDTIELRTPSKAKNLKKVQAISLLEHVDGIINLSHFKGHIASGVGGAIKNISMGMTSRATKQMMHADVEPILEEEKCTSCGRCVKICSENAISIASDHAVIDIGRCVGCAECIAICPEGALKIIWTTDRNKFLEKLAESAAAINDKIGRRMIHLNLLVNITSLCDCQGTKMKPIFPDIGIAISQDPIAVDIASADLVNKCKPLNNSELNEDDEDKIGLLHPDIPWRRQFEYGETLGIGTCEYELIEV